MLMLAYRKAEIVRFDLFGLEKERLTSSTLTSLEAAYQFWRGFTMPSWTM